MNLRLTTFCAALLLAACNDGKANFDGGVLDTAPTVSLASSATSVTASGSVTLVAAAVDDTTVSRVEFYEGTTKLSQTMLTPYVHLLTFAAADNGTHTYTAKAFDSGSKTGTSNPVTITVNIGGTGGGAGGAGGGTGGGAGGGTGGGAGGGTGGGAGGGTGGGAGGGTGGGAGGGTGGGAGGGTGGGAGGGTGGGAGGGTAGGAGGGTAGGAGGGAPDTTPPVVSLVANPNSVSAAMPLVLTATATDNVGVVKVELFDGFTKVGELNQPTAGATWVFNFNLTAADNGTHHYLARAWDAALNNSQSAVATVNVVIASPSAIKQVVGGPGFSYLVKNDGSVFVSGSALYGTIGSSSFQNFSLVPGFNIKATGFGSNAYEALFVMPDDSLQGIGSNLYGQLGRPVGSMQTYSIPTPASPPVAGVASVFAGEYTSCFVKLDTTVWCMGYSYLGNGLNGTGSPTPSQVVYSDGGTLTGAVQVISGYEAQTLLKSDGTVWAWGRGDLGTGEVGDGTSVNRYGAVQVIYLNGTPVSGASQIAGTRGASFALIADGGTVVAWGSNFNGMLGDNSTATARLVATPVFGLTGVTGIAGGEGHVLAVDDQGSVWAWGTNTGSALGNPAAGSSSNKPVQVPNLSGVAKVAAGRNTSFALKANGELWGWGGDNYALGINDGGVIITTPHAILVP